MTPKQILTKFSDRVKHQLKRHKHTRIEICKNYHRESMDELIFLSDGNGFIVDNLVDTDNVLVAGWSGKYRSTHGSTMDHSQKHPDHPDNDIERLSSVSPMLITIDQSTVSDCVHGHEVLWQSVCLMLGQCLRRWPNVNPLKPEFTIVIFIHYKPRIAVAILDL